MNYNVTIVLYIVFPRTGKGGPKSLSCYIHKAIKRWNENKILTKKARLILKEKIDFSTIKKVINKKNTYIWLQRSNYIYLVHNRTYDSIFAKIIYGPNVTPLRWFISLNTTYEGYWCKIMKKIFGYVVHSKRVKKQIMKNTKCNMFSGKYILLKPCAEIYIEVKSIKEYEKREIDFLIYVKYADLNKNSDEQILINYLKQKYRIEIIKYGNHSRKSLLLLANNSKFIIYFSFYDTGALSLIEIKSMGVWPISHQKEFIEEGYGSFLKELDTDIHKSLIKLDKIYRTKFYPKILAKNVNDNLNCIKSLQYLVTYIQQNI